MLTRRQDLSVLFLYFIGYSRIRNLVFRLQRKPITRVVIFHDIPSATIARFEANLSFLKQSTNVVSLEDYFSGRLSSRKINVVITFDDGYKSWVTYAVPILKRLRLPATFFISSGFVGLSNEADSLYMRSKLLLNPAPGSLTTGLSIEDVRRLSLEGFSVGGHSFNHSDLTKIRDLDVLRGEIADDKVKLERIIGKEIEYFAYPFGRYRNTGINLSEVLKEVGYRGALTTVSGPNTVDTNPYLLHREITDAAMPGCVFRARVYGNYDAVRFLKQRVTLFFQGQ